MEILFSIIAVSLIYLGVLANYLIVKQEFNQRKSKDKYNELFY